MTPKRELVRRQRAWARSLGLERFAGHLGTEFRFHAVTYQALFRRLVSSGGAGADYLAYPESRYFPARGSGAA